MSKFSSRMLQHLMFCYVVFCSTSSLVSVRYKELCHGMVTKHLQEQIGVRRQVLGSCRDALVHSRRHVLHVKLFHSFNMDLLNMLLQVPLVFRFQWAVRALVNNILMFCLNVLLYIPDLGVFIVTEIALVLQSFVLTIDVPLQGTFIDGDKVAVLACESDAPVNRLNVPEECALGPGHKGALLTWKPSICVRVHLCNSSTPGNLWTVAHGCWC